MRTTIDIPDDLFRRAKAEAALQGVRLRDLIERGLRQVLSGSMQGTRPRRVAFPIVLSRDPGTLSPDSIRKVQDAARLDEDAGHAGTL
jgi:hypothetical protein